jgi:hypothetical protein
MSFLLALALLIGATVSQNPADVRARAKQGVPGRLVYTDPTVRRGDGINSGGQVAQVGTIVVTTATDSATYSFTLNGVAFAVVNGTSSTTTTVATLIAAAINAEPLVRGQVTATSATATVTITANTAGTRGAFTLTESDSKITGTEASTAAADASTVPFGVALVSLGTTATPASGALATIERKVQVPTTSVFTAQVQTLAISYVSTAVIEVAVYEIRGAERIFIASAITAMATDQDTSLDALVTALNAKMPANTVDFAADNATATAIVGTAEILGFEFDLEFHHNSTSTEPTVTKTLTTGPSVSTSLHRAFLGITEYSQADEANALTSTSGSYPANAGVVYIKRGCVWVSNSESTGPALGGDVYVELAPGSTAGQLYAASSATRVALSKRVATWERDGIVTADNLSAVRLEA